MAGHRPLSQPCGPAGIPDILSFLIPWVSSAYDALPRLYRRNCNNKTFPRQGEAHLQVGGEYGDPQRYLRSPGRENGIFFSRARRTPDGRLFGRRIRKSLAWRSNNGKPTPDPIVEAGASAKPIERGWPVSYRGYRAKEIACYGSTTEDSAGLTLNLGTTVGHFGPHNLPPGLEFQHFLGEPIDSD